MPRSLISALTSASLIAAPVGAQTITIGNTGPEMAKVLGKPIPKTQKQWWPLWYELLAKVKPVVPDWSPPPAIASNFDTAAFLTRTGPAGGRIPPSAAPDVVGAFRLICQPAHVGYLDPMVYPRQRGVSELHEFAGNTLTDENSTYASLRAKGDSTCMNILNRSAYWHPAMLNAAGKVIRFDYTSLYYKRRPASDPECTKLAKKGCVGLPNGLVAKEYVDHFRCATGAGPHRATVAEALADCVGPVKQVLASVIFGECWTGKVDSTDHRSHLSAPKPDPTLDGAPNRCPAGYDYDIPQLTQTIAWTVLPSDGEVRFSMPHFHANYMLAWDPATLDRAMANCIDKLLNCASGELGDGTQMKPWAGFTEKANPRLVPVPAREVH